MSEDSLHSRTRSNSPARRRHRVDSASRSRSRSRSRSTSGSRSRSRSHARSQSPTQSRSRSGSRSSSSFHDARSKQPSPSPLARAARPDFRPRLVLSGHQKPISQVRISPNGRWIASASADGTIRIWDAVTGQHMDTLIGHMAGVSAVAWAPDSETLATGSDDKAIRLWDRVTGRPKRAKPLLGHHNYVYCLAFSPKGNIIASGSYDEAVFLWDVRAGRLMRSLPAHSDPVSGIDFCCDGTLVVSCSTDGLTRIWDTATGQCLRTLVHEDNPPVTSVCFSPNGRFVLAHSMDSCIRLWNYVSGTVKKTYQGHVNKGFSIGGCFGTIDGEAFIASSSEDGSIVLWDVKSKQVIQRIDRGHDGVCFWVDVNGDTLVSAGQDCKIRVYQHRRPETLLNGAEEGEEEEGQLHGEKHVNGVKQNGTGENTIGDETPIPGENGDTEMQDVVLDEAGVKLEQS
ncbi:WD40-repeat-containing domain protein [Microdochium trichocladiopsis]|uniref:Mitochondrial division protein 1 n=1 Tax=Microdochium trichocladiopsis TaxID=1682393 RepID=A0A9P8YBS9_9PEZI|nr:WD40-repeat-containing domain protein [Microdochium trichocladiopsis]KAH7035154.1 WD40-repeat-containing domain protein [Microdochium trichocladiopsis]